MRNGHVFILLFCVLSVTLCAMESGKKRLREDGTLESSLPNKKAKSDVFALRNIPSLKALTAAFIARKNICEPYAEIFTQLSSQDERERFDCSCYNSATNELPENLARYVFEMEMCLKDPFPMAYAAAHGNRDVLEFLLARCKTRDEYEKTLHGEDGNDIPFLRAVIESETSPDRQIQVVEYLLKKGANVNAREGNALRVAAKRQSINLVRCLFRHGADVNVCKDCLIESIDRDDLSVARFLLERGADVYASNGEALRRVGNSGTVEALELLFSVVKAQGKTVVDFINRSRDSYGKTALNVAHQADNKKVMRAMVAAIIAETDPKEVSDILVRFS